MAQERLAPDALLAVTALSGTVADIQDDPDSPDAAWLVASDNNTNVDARVSFPTPANAPTAGAGLQELRVQVGQFDTGQTGTPLARIELWQNGVLVRAGTDTNITSASQVLSLTFDIAEVTLADGSQVECRVVGTKSGGGPSARNTVNIGAIEWNAETSIAALTIAPTGITSAEGFGSQTVVPGSVAVAPAGIASNEALGSAVINPVYTLLATAIASLEVFGTADIQTGASSINATGIASSEAIGSQTVTPGAVSIDPIGMPSAEGFGAATVTSSYDLILTAIDSLEAFGSQTVLPGAMAIDAAGIGSGEAFGTADINQGGVTINATGIASAEVIGNPVLSAVYDLIAQAIASAEAVGNISISPVNDITPNGIASGEAVGNAAISAVYDLLAQSIASLEAVGNAELIPNAVSINPGSIASAEAFGLSLVELGPFSITVNSGIGSGEQFGTATLVIGPAAFGWLKATFETHPALMMSLDITPALSVELGVNQNG